MQEVLQEILGELREIRIAVHFMATEMVERKAEGQTAKEALVEACRPINPLLRRAVVAAKDNIPPQKNEGMNDRECWRKALELARMLEGASVNDAERVLHDAAEFIRRGSLVTTAGCLFSTLEESLLSDS